MSKNKQKQSAAALHKSDVLPSISFLYSALLAPVPTRKRNYLLKPTDTIFLLVSVAQLY
jgi:hypothetical protein